jgi:hypothetical protein
MLDSQSKVGIAQIALFIPILFFGSYVLYRNGTQQSRTAWLSLVAFSLGKLLLSLFIQYLTDMKQFV